MNARLLRPAFGVGLTLALLTLLSLNALRRASALRAGWPPEADTYYIPSSRTLRTLSLGHHEMAADLLAARANVYFGTQLVYKGQFRWLDRYINTAVDLDPRFHRLYMVGSAVMIYNGKTITAEAVEAANGILRRGVENFPYEWEMMFQLGFNLLFEYPKLIGENDPRAARSRQEGVELLQRAALFENVPTWLPGLTTRMLTKRGSDEMAIRHLEQAYAVASEEARKHILYKLTKLKRAGLAEQLEEDRRRFEEQIRPRYPYAPDAFSAIAGPRRPRTVDLETGP